MFARSIITATKVKNSLNKKFLSSDAQSQRMKVVFTWGNGTDGELGHAKFNTKTEGTFSFLGLQTPEYNQDEPRRMVRSKKFSSLAIGSSFTLGLTHEGEMFGWGKDYLPKVDSLEPKQIPIEKKIVSISAGTKHAAAIDAEGQIYTWGFGGTMFSGHGSGSKLGHGSTHDEASPKLIEIFKGYGAKAKQVSCGDKHTLFLTDDGEVLTCGSCDFGLLGTGSATDVKTPMTIETLQNENIVQIAAGKDHSIVLTDDGRVFTWGRSSSGQLGHGDSILDMYSLEDYPRIIDNESFGDKSIKYIAAMREKSAAITSDGELYIWGTRYGQSPSLILPSSFEGLKVTKVAMGGDSGAEVIAVLTEDNSLWLFGHGNSKMLGSSTNNKQGWTNVPMRVTNFPNNNVKVLDIFCGPGQHMGVIAEIDTN